MTLFYEDIQIGASYTTPTHRITESDIADFCRLTRDHHPLHTDPDQARKAGFPASSRMGFTGWR